MNSPNYQELSLQCTSMLQLFFSVRRCKIVSVSRKAKVNRRMKIFCLDHGYYYMVLAAKRHPVVVEVSIT